MQAFMGFSNNKIHKRSKSSRTALRLRKWGVAGLAFVICFMMLSSPVYAATQGSGYHKDTRDYCMIVHDVTAGLQELEGKSVAEKEVIVEAASEYSIHTWLIFTT